MALAAMSAVTCGMLGLRCGAIIIDHGLQDETAQVTIDTAERCRSLGLDPVVTRRVDVDRGNGAGVEAAARDARYRAITGTAHDTGAAAVLLAHTMDDQAETVLMGLMRKRGIGAVAGMPESTVRDGVLFLRPLLALRRSETTGICTDLCIDYWDDPTNGEDAEGPLPSTYPLRSRVRHDLMPVLTGFFGSDVARTLSDGARLAADDKALLDTIAGAAAARIVRRPADGTICIDAAGLAAEHPAIRRRVINHALADAGITASAAQTEAIDALASNWHGQNAVSIRGGHDAGRTDGVITIR